MATRGMIGYWNKETGEVTASYVHYDSYLEGVGVDLIKHYNTDDLAKAIANIGYASSLDTTVAETKAAAVHQNEPVELYKSVAEYLKTAGNSAGAEYLYLWDGQCWFVSEQYGSDKRFTDVETILQKAA